MLSCAQRGLTVAVSLGLSRRGDRRVGMKNMLGAQLLPEGCGNFRAQRSVVRENIVRPRGAYDQR